MNLVKVVGMDPVKMKIMRIKVCLNWWMRVGVGIWVRMRMCLSRMSMRTGYERGQG